MKNANLATAAAALVLSIHPALSPLVSAQEQRRNGGSEAQRPASEAFRDVAAMAEASARELAEVQEAIDAEKVPLTKRLSELESALIDVQREEREARKVLGARELDRANTEATITGNKQTNDYLKTQLDTYLREFENLIHIAEEQRYRDRMDTAQALLKADASLEEAFKGRLDMVELSMDRLEEAAGGALFDGTATDEDGLIAPGKFLVVGPRAYFAGESDGHIGFADSNNEASQPTVTRTPAELKPAIREVVLAGQGDLPVDVTEGEAIGMERTKTSLGDEVEAGGMVMYPLLGLGGLSVLIAIFKWLQFVRIKRVGRRRFRELLKHLDEGDVGAARDEVRGAAGPVGALLEAGIAHHQDPPELIEEVLYEQMIKARQTLNSFIPFIKITAAAAPLLGLLGTVSGMINTFKLITVFGTGDPSTFASGISEALITTKWGLIVAIPCLLLAAFLHRRARGITDDMEKLSLAFVNHFRGDDDEVELDDDDNITGADRRGGAVIEAGEKEAGGGVEPATGGAPV